MQVGVNVIPILVGIGFLDLEIIATFNFGKISLFVHGGQKFNQIELAHKIHASSGSHF